MYKCLKLTTLIFFVMVTITSFAQQQRFDVVSYTVPNGWQKTQQDALVQLAVTDKKTGAYAIAIITKATTSDAAPNNNFSSDWEKLVKGTVQVNAPPTMQAPTHSNGWDIISGGANYTDGTNKGAATLLTATGGGQTFSVVVMTNTQQYQNDLGVFLNSLALATVSSTPTVNNNPTTTNNNHSSVVGLWVIRQRESRGAGKFSTYTGGYMRKEYQFNKDGTYLFRVKNWLVANEKIYFVSESGTWSANANQLTLTPIKGKGGWWYKDKGNDVDKWGGFQKAADYKLQTTTYRFEIKEDSNYGNSIVLYSSKPTERDGGQFNEPPYRFSYTTPGDPHPWIDNPPGWKD